MPFDELWDEKYSDNGLVKQLHKTLGEQTKFKDLEKGVVVTSYDLYGVNTGGPRPFIFNSREDRFQTIDLWKAARATSAAPTYFPSYNGLDGHVLIDGGVIANHPGNVGITELTSLYPQKQRDDLLEQIHMVSFGTGIFYKPIPPEKAKDMGLLEWAGPISGVCMQGTSDLVDEALQNTLGSRYVRLNTRLEKDIPLDGVSKKDIETLQEVSLHYIEQNPEIIDRAAKLMLR